MDNIIKLLKEHHARIYLNGKCVIWDGHEFVVCKEAVRCGNDLDKALDELAKVD